MKLCSNFFRPRGLLAALGLWAAAATAPAQLVITEIMSQQSPTALTGAQDYVEVTNFSGSSVDLEGYSWHDSGRNSTAAAAYALPAGTRVGPYESIIFTHASPSVFRAWWGIPAHVQVFQTAAAPGLGSGDGVALYDRTGAELVYLSYGVGGFTREDGTQATGGHAGPSAGGSLAYQAMIWVPGSGITAPRYTFASGTNYSTRVAVTGADVGSPGTAGLPLNVDLSMYVRIGRYDLPEPTRTTPPDDISLLAQEASGVAYNWDTDTLFITADGGTSIVQVTKTGQLVDSMTLARGSSPQGTDFYDPEGIAYIGNNQFVISEERDRQLVLFSYAAGTTLSRSGAKTVKLGTFAPNTGLEGLCYDPLTGGYICVKEISPQGIFQTMVDFEAGTATNGSPTTENSVNLFDPALAGLLDLADVFALSNLPSMQGRPEQGNLLLLSQESARIVNIDRNGNIVSSLDIQTDAGNPLSASNQQHEGLTMDRNGLLYVVNENGGGNADRPQLWVYAPATQPNQAPSSVTLANAVTTLPENTNTSVRVKVADITIEDDGLGTNVVTLSGTDAGFFEVVAGGLFIKAGTVLDFETKAFYNVIVEVDDTSVGVSPDATVTYSLTLTDIEDETPVIPALIISEIAPWSSGNSPVGDDWFELTNTGSTPIDITGWRVDDNSNSFANSVALSGITTIAPGESVIFIENGAQPGKVESFINNWFGVADPVGLQIGSYAGSGIGLSTGGDALNIYDGAGILQASVSFGASPTGPVYATFNNAQGLDGTVVALLSTAGVNGAFVAVNSPSEVGSPGTVGRIFISEVAPWSSGNSPVQADWFEVTNSTAHAVDITGWKVDDNSESFVAAVALNGITTIAPGESVIFLESSNLEGIRTSFRANWFGETPPAGLQIGAYSGSGIGLGTSGDAVCLYDSNGILRARVSFGASPSGPEYPTFDNTAALNGAEITLFSSVGLNGAFIAANSPHEIGSPGSATPGGTPSVSLTVSVSPDTFSESATNPAAIGTVTRIGSTLGNLVVNLSSNDMSEATVPATVTILAGEASATFPVHAVDDTSADGSQTVRISASGIGTNPGFFEITVLDDGDAAAPATLLITEIQSNQSSGAPAGTNDYWELTNLGTASVDLGGYKWTDSEGANVVTLPQGTTIEAGKSVIFTTTAAATFRTWWGLNETVKVVTAASAPGLGMNDGIRLMDSANTTVQFLSYAAAGFKLPNGNNSAGGHAGISAGGTQSSQALVWDPSSSLEDPRYTFADGTTLGTFVAAQGSDLGSPGTTGPTTVPDITLTLNVAPASFSESAANPAATGTVTRDGDTTAPLVVTLASADPSEALVPTTVTIPAGQASATFAVTAVDDSFPDGDVTFNITASAENAGMVTFAITVLDDGDVLNLTLMLTELQSNQSGSAPAGAADYWELTNFGSTAVSLAGYSWHDSGRSSAIAQNYKLPAGASIAAGESVIFTVANPTAFRSWWGLSPAVKIFQTLGAPGLGKDDGIALFDEGGNELFYFTYGPGGFVREDGTPSTGDHAGLSAGGSSESQALIWVPSSGTVAPRYVAATGRNHGSFQPAVGADLGSPGITDGISPPLRDASLVTQGPLRFARLATVSLAGAEISAFDPASKRLFVTCSAGLQVIDISNPAAPQVITTVTFTQAPISLSSSDITSVACHEGVLAVAVPHADKREKGHVVFLNAADGSYISKVQVGYLPDHVTFTPDGRKVLTADEGEYQLDGTDPNPGTVSIIDVSSGYGTATVQTAGFEAFDAQAQQLKSAGVRLFERGGVLTQPSLEFEPEYLAVSPDSSQAMVTLQEANAVALLDIATATFTSVVPLGEKDFSTLLADFSDRDGPGDTNLINLTTGNPVFGLYMPDAIASFKAGGQTYYVTANEGDDRNDFITSPTETTTVGNGAYVLDPEVFPNAAQLKANARLGRLTVSNSPGLRGDTNNDGLVDRILMYGARSFSILDATGSMVYDSGDDIEVTLAGIGSPLFDDSRSDNKGPEPEGIAIGVIDDRTYAFVGLERHRSIIVYDVTDPANVTRAGLVSYPEDLNPEGITFIPAAKSPNGIPMIAVTNETSNTLTLFSVQPENFTLQVLHLADGEAGLLAAQTAPHLAALVDAFDGQYDNTLILSGGDNFIPSPFLNAGTDPSLSAVSGIGATAFARPDIAIHNFIGVEASAIGNHEWDLGSNVFMDAIASSGAWGGAQFPHISSNLDYSADSAANARFTQVPLDGAITAVPEATSLKTRLVPAAVITKGGQKIGLVGVTTQLLRAISSPSGTFAKGFPPGTTGVDDMDLLATHVQPYIDELTAEGVNKIILLSHLQQLSNERLLATKLRGVDIILAAGSNTRLGDADDVAVAFPGHSADFADTYPIITAGADSKPTLIINTDNEYTYLGRLTVEFDAEGLVIVSNLSDRVPINGAYAATAANVAAAWNTTVDHLASTAFAPGTKGARVKAVTDAVQNVINNKDGQVFGYTSVYLEGERSFVRSQETNLGNITADANADALRQIIGGNVPVVSVKNGGGIRAQIGAVSSQPGSSEKLPPPANPAVGKAEGGISLLDVENALRFNNRLMAFDTTPRGLKAILEHGVAAWPNQGRFPHVGGVAFAWNPALPPGNRVTSMALVDENDQVTVPLFKNGLFSFLAPQVIRVVTLNFMAQGGDGYPMKANGANFRYILNNGSLGPVIGDKGLDFTVVPQLPGNSLGEQQAFTDYISSRYATPETAYAVADTPASLDQRIQNLSFRTEALVPGEITADSDGDGLTDVEELAYGGNPNAALRVGEEVMLNFGILRPEGGALSLVGKLPAGLKFDTSTGALTGVITGNAGSYPLQLVVSQDGVIVRTVAVDMNVAAFPVALVGSYESLIEEGPGSPKGVLRLSVTRAGQFTATLEYAGAARRSGKGSFSLTSGSNVAELNLSFPATAKALAFTGQLQVATDSPLTSGTFEHGADSGTLRGFRIAASNANPPVVQKIVTLLDAGQQDGSHYPAGLGWAKGSVSKTGTVRLKGLLGDARPVTLSLRLSATSQALLWSQPYKNKASYLGGILLLGDLGQPLNLPQRLENGLVWFKAPDSKEKSYAAGFDVPLAVTGHVSRYAAVKTGADLAATLGLNEQATLEVTIAGAGLSNGQPNNTPTLPTQFTLDSKFNLTVTAPAEAVAWKGKIAKSDGGFAGTLNLPEGKAATTGVILQDESFGSQVGGGLIKVPVAGGKGEFRTSALLLGQD